MIEPEDDDERGPLLGSRVNEPLLERESSNGMPQTNVLDMAIYNSLAAFLNLNYYNYSREKIGMAIKKALQKYCDMSAKDLGDVSLYDATKNAFKKGIKSVGTAVYNTPRVLQNTGPALSNLPNSAKEELAYYAKGPGVVGRDIAYITPDPIKRAAKSFYSGTIGRLSGRGLRGGKRTRRRKPKRK